jgi:hypothetical protein
MSEESTPAPVISVHNS